MWNRCGICLMLPSGRLKYLSKWRRQNRIVIHPGKTKRMVTALRQKHQIKPLMLKLTLCTNIVEQVREHRVLAVTFDEDLKRQSHVNNVCKQLKVSFCLCHFPSASIPAPNWHKLSELIVCFSVVHRLEKEEFLKNSHILPRFVWLKSILLTSCVSLILFAWPA